MMTMPNPTCPTCGSEMVFMNESNPFSEYGYCQGSYFYCIKHGHMVRYEEVANVYISELEAKVAALEVVKDSSPTVRDLHNTAMDLAQYMHVSKRLGWNLSRDVFIAAYELEYRAAKEAIRHAEEQQRECEPTRSILLKSAAWLAWNAGLWHDAITTANECLSGKPDSIIRAEMADCITKSKQGMRDECMDLS